MCLCACSVYVYLNCLCLNCLFAMAMTVLIRKTPGIRDHVFMWCFVYVYLKCLGREGGGVRFANAKSNHNTEDAKTSQSSLQITCQYCMSCQCVGDSMCAHVKCMTGAPNLNHDCKKTGWGRGEFGIGISVNAHASNLATLFPHACNDCLMSISTACLRCACLVCQMDAVSKTCCVYLHVCCIRSHVLLLTWNLTARVIYVKFKSRISNDVFICICIASARTPLCCLTNWPPVSLLFK